MYLRQNESIARATFVILRIASPSRSFSSPLPPLSLALALVLTLSLSRCPNLRGRSTQRDIFVLRDDAHVCARIYAHFPGAHLTCEFLQPHNRVMVANFYLMLAESNPMQFKCRILDVCLSKLVICKRGFFEHNSWMYFFCCTHISLASFSQFQR